MANTNAVSILSHNRSLLLHNSRLPIMYLVININIISIEYYVFLFKNCGKIPLICIDFNIIFIGYLLIYFGNVVGIVVAVVLESRRANQVSIKNLNCFPHRRI